MQIESTSTMIYGVQLNPENGECQRVERLVKQTTANMLTFHLNVYMKHMPVKLDLYPGLAKNTLY